MTVKSVAVRLMSNTEERKEAERMIGKSFEKMSIDERRLSAAVLSAFYGLWNRSGRG